MKMIIALDHGNKSIKTAPSGMIFPSGLNESSAPLPFGRDVLKRNGKYYTISEQRMPYQRDKTVDDRFYLLSLFGIAYELEAAKANTEDIIEVTLLVGLPPAHFGMQYERFENYFSKDKQIEEFVFRGKRYFIYIKEAMAYPQAYAAAMQVFGQIRLYSKTIVLDLGGMTLDYLSLKNGQADLAACDSLENGVIIMYNKIKSKMNSNCDLLLDESDIDDILNGEETSYSRNVTDMVLDMAQEFIDDMLSKLRERMIDLKTCKTVFVGGGSMLLRKQIMATGKVSEPIFINDIGANAKGYEILYNVSQTGR